jgi:hypothetical protein
MVLSNQKSQYSVIGCPPPSEFCEACQGDRPRYLPFYRYKKHPGLDVNVKNARVRARAEVRRHNAIQVVCGDKDCSCYYPRGLSSVGGTNNKGVFRG